MKTTVYFNIGSNIGDRRAFIARAVPALYNLPGVKVDAVRQSAYVETEPWGFSSDNTFLNLGVAVDADIDTPWCEATLKRLLKYVKEVEKSISAMPHRKPDGTYDDREVDVDIIAVDELAFNSDTLTLPHPKMHLRSFVLGPLAELAPGWRHPLSGLTAAEIFLSTK